MWRRAPEESQSDRDDLARVAAGLVLVGLALLAALLIGGCAGQVRPECPLGAILVRADTDSASSGAAGATVGVLTQSGSGQARWRGAGSVDWSCARICYPGQLLRASRDERGVVRVECMDTDRGAAGKRADGSALTPGPAPAAPAASPTR